MASDLLKDYDTIRAWDSLNNPIGFELLSVRCIDLFDDFVGYWLPINLAPLLDLRKAD